MDMKKFLQAVDGASSSKKSAEGSSDMKKFLRVVKEADLNQTPAAPAPDQFDAVTLDSADGFKDAVKKAAAQLKTDAAPQTPVYERSIFGKYFKKVEQEITEHRQQTKDKAELLAEKVSKKIMKRISERVTIGPDGQTIGGFKPTPADPDAPVKPAATQEPSATIPGSNLQKAEKADKESGTITVGGQEYNMVMLPPGGIRPRSGKKIAIPQAVMGERGIGNYIGILTNGTVYVIPKGEQ
jgi:hypothetical protein